MTARIYCLVTEQALLNTTEVTQQQCSVSFGWQPTNDLTSLPVDLWGRGRDADEPWVWPEVGDAGTSGAGAVPLRSAQLMGQREKNKKCPLQLQCPVAMLTTVAVTRCYAHYRFSPVAMSSTDAVSRCYVHYKCHVSWLCRL